MAAARSNRRPQLLLPCAPLPRADAVLRRSSSIRAYGAPRRRRGLPGSDGGADGQGPVRSPSSASRGWRPRLRVTHLARIGHRSVGGGGGGRLNGGTALPSVVHGKPMWWICLLAAGDGRLIQIRLLRPTNS